MTAPKLTPLLLGVLGFTSAVSPLATDMYLASFASIQSDLGTTAPLVQLTLSVYFLGVAFGQLIIGPLSDGLGRRRVLLIALAIFATFSVLLVFAPSIEVFIALRLLLGFSGSAGIVIARAIAADLSTGDTAVKALSIIAMVGGLGPLLAPPIGGLTHELWGWRGTLATLAAISIIMFASAWACIPESLPRERRVPLSLRSTFASLGTLLRNRRFVGFTLTFAFGFSAMICYISASPFVAQVVLGMSPLVYSLGFATSASSLVLTNIVNARIAPRFGPRRVLGVALGLLAVGSTGMLILALSGLLSPWNFILCAFILTSGAGATMSNSSALALAEAQHARGLGSALLGCTQFGLAGVLAPVVGLWGEHTALPMGIVVLTATGCAIVAAVWAGRASATRT